MKGSAFVVLLWLVLFELASAGSAPSKPLVVRVGYFPNVTHAQALVARQLSRQGKGWFEKGLGTNVQIRWFAYNAGPSAMEAFFANSLDLSYVGPNPALNAYIRSEGKEVRILAGAARGGAGLVVQKDIRAAADLRGKKVATPQFGNTQDVSCRVWLEEQGFKISLRGGDVQVVPTPNPEQLSLFTRGALAGAWSVEPWLSRLELEAGGHILVAENDAITAILVARAGFLHEQGELAAKFAKAHAELSVWLHEHASEAQALVQKELTAQMRREFPEKLVEQAWKRLRFTNEVSLDALEKIVQSAQRVGLLKRTVPLKGLMATP